MGFLHDLVAPFNRELFTLGTDHVTYAELLGFITGLWCVYLTVRAHVSNFPVGIANNVFFFLLFINAALFADAYLQLVYLGLAAYGWWAWLRKGPDHGKLAVTDASVDMCIWTGLAVVVVTAIMYPILKGAHDIAPFWDALTTGLSLGAQFLLNLKKVQNWYFWIVADLIYIPLYFVKNLYLTGIVYVFFLTLCVAGLNLWTIAREDRKRVVA